MQKNTFCKIEISLNFSIVYHYPFFQALKSRLPTTFNDSSVRHYLLYVSYPRNKNISKKYLFLSFLLNFQFIHCTLFLTYLTVSITILYNNLIFLEYLHTYIHLQVRFFFRITYIRRIKICIHASIHAPRNYIKLLTLIILFC